MLALAGCIFSVKPVFDPSKGATDIAPGRFEIGTGPEKRGFQLTRHGSVYVYRDDNTRANDSVVVLSFHAIGDGFYLLQTIPQDTPVGYAVVDARARDEIRFSWLDCLTDTPADRLPSPDAKGRDRCRATDPERLTAIAGRYKADLLANRIEASNVSTITRIQ
jgi:hypothetical protein